MKLRLTLLNVSCGLKCWHCIADDCHLSPYDYQQAESRSCRPGQSCQKVVFEMYNEDERYTYRSTVRSCADQCYPQDDFINCTDPMYTTRGCVQRVCCDDSDMCNSAPGAMSTDHWTEHIPVALLLVSSRLILTS